MGRKKTQFGESAELNTRSYQYYFYRLKELAISMFDWKGLPSTIDPRYIELGLFENNCMVYFKDEVMGDLCLNCLPQSMMTVYGDPIKRRAYSKYNNYQKELSDKDSVIIWNNYLRLSSYNAIDLFARRLYNLDRVIDVNCNAQKTPVLVTANEQQRMTMINLYKEYDGNQPFIFGDKMLDQNSLKAINTGAPYVADRLYEMKRNLWAEALNYLGINAVQDKRERLVSQEAFMSQGDTISARYSRLRSRQEAAEKINRMFDTKITVDYAKDFQMLEENEVDEDGVKHEEEGVFIE